MRSSWLIVQLTWALSLLISCLLGLSVHYKQNGVEVSSCNRGLIYLPHSSSRLCLVYFDTHKLSRVVNVFLENWPFHHYPMPFFMSDHFLCSDVCFVWHEYNHFSFPLMYQHGVTFSILSLLIYQRLYI